MRTLRPAATLLTLLAGCTDERFRSGDPVDAPRLPVEGPDAWDAGHPVVAEGEGEGEGEGPAEGEGEWEPDAGRPPLPDPVCGNAILEPGEECDDGNLEEDDGCDAACRIITPPACGDGYLGRGEECDDGNREPYDGCDPACRLERCDPDLDLGVLLPDETVTRLVDLEVADDSELACGRGTDVVLSFTLEDVADLRLETGQTADASYGLYRAAEARCTADPMDCYHRPGAASSLETLYDLQPDTYLLIVEEGVPGNGASAFVSLTILGQLTGCGNGLLDPGEACDDGNHVSGDGCDEDCSSDETCGNGVLDEDRGEECDDGNLRPGDRCDARCRLEPAECRVDEDLGPLEPGLEVRRALDVREATDHWLTACAPQGRELVTAFELVRPGDLTITLSGLDDHAFGLYQRARLEDACIADQGLCGNATRSRGYGGILWENAPPGRYYFLLEQDGDHPTEADLSLHVAGCHPDREAGTLGRGEALDLVLDTSHGNGIHDAGCGAGSGRERVVAFELAQAGSLAVEFDQAGDHVIGLFREAGTSCDGDPVSCHDPAAAVSGRVVFPRLEPGPYLLLLDAHDDGGEGEVRLRLQVE